MPSDQNRLRLDRDLIRGMSKHGDISFSTANKKSWKCLSMNYLVASSQGQLKMAEDLSDAASPTEQSFRRPMGRKLILYWGMGFFSSCACLCVCVWDFLASIP